MAERKTPKNPKGRSKGQEGRITLRIRGELIQDLETLANGEELSLSAYIRQLLKHEVVAMKKQEQEVAEFRQGQGRIQSPKSLGSRRRLVG